MFFSGVHIKDQGMFGKIQGTFEWDTMTMIYEKVL